MAIRCVVVCSPFPPLYSTWVLIWVFACQTGGHDRTGRSAQHASGSAATDADPIPQMRILAGGMQAVRTKSGRLERRRPHKLLRHVEAIRIRSRSNRQHDGQTRHVHQGQSRLGIRETFFPSRKHPFLQCAARNSHPGTAQQGLSSPLS